MKPITFSHRLSRRDLVLLLSSTLMAPLTVSANQAYPSRPVTLVVPYPPGGAADLLGRLLAEQLSRRWGQPVVIDNKVGASGQIGTEYVGKAKGDPYKLVIGTQAVFSVLPSLNKRTDFNLETGYSPISLLIEMPSVLMVPASLGVNTTEELIALLKAGKPFQYAYSSNGPGTSQQLIAADFFEKIGVQLTHVPYKGSSQALTALAAGDQIIVSVDNVPSATPLIQSGKVKALAVTASSRVSKFPDIRTVAESGVAGFDQSTWMGIMAPPGIPQDVQLFLNREIRAVMASSVAQQTLAQHGFLARTGSPADFQKFVAAETAALRKLLERLQLLEG